MTNKEWRRLAAKCKNRTRDFGRDERFPGHWMCSHNFSLSRCMERRCPMVEWWDEGHGLEALTDGRGLMQAGPHDAGGSI